MLNIASLGEIFIIGTVALIVIGPKEMPTVLRNIGKAIYKIRLVMWKVRQEFEEYIQEDDLTSQERPSDSGSFSSFLYLKDKDFLNTEPPSSSSNSSERSYKDPHET